MHTLSRDHALIVRCAWTGDAAKCHRMRVEASPAAATTRHLLHCICESLFLSVCSTVLLAAGHAIDLRTVAKVSALQDSKSTGTRALKTVLMSPTWENA